jgi:hypothetical protein
MPLTGEQINWLLDGYAGYNRVRRKSAVTIREAIRSVRRVKPVPGGSIRPIIRWPQ